MTTFRYFLVLLCWACLSRAGRAQEIHFGDYTSATASLSELSGTDLDFGFVITGDGTKSISLADSKVIAITGLKFLDVILTVDADPDMLLDGNPSCQSDPNCSIPFTLQAAYANLGSNNISQAHFLTVSGNSVTRQFPVLGRTNGPPGPPPIPPNKNFNAAEYEETAYLYIYGSINVGDVDAGTYTSQITISITYN